MKDQVFIRYFELKSDNIPKDSYAICDLDSQFIATSITNYTSNIEWWLRKHPKGRVDFVVL